MGVMDDAERFEPATARDWSDWLEHNHRTAPGVWLVTPRRASDPPTVDYETAVVEALRFGWVDATVRPLDDQRAMQWFSPRRPGSGWSSSNKTRIDRLRAQGRLEPPGERAVRLAQENGSWTMYDDVEALVVPEDLGTALAARPGARDAWDGFSPTARKLMLAWLVQAKRPETREKRILDIADKAARGERAR